MKPFENFSEEIRLAFDEYVKRRKKHEALLVAKDQFPSISDWQNEVQSADKSRRDAHNAAARLMIAHGFSPRLEDEYETLKNARGIVKQFLGLP